jgi:L-asparaginase/Glu-tRNA(Gln) amidotransferase subunit D
MSDTVLNSLVGRIAPELSEDDIGYYTSVHILNCGGTINMRGLSERRPSDGLGKAIGQIRETLAKLRIEVRTESPFLRPPDSTNIGSQHWDAIVGYLNRILERKWKLHRRLKEAGLLLEAGGIVVTHGTDTLHLSSLAIALEMSLVRRTVPIVFTGSFLPPDAPGSDAVDNLVKAIAVAKQRFSGTARNVPIGVYVLIGQEIHLATRISKVRTSPDSDGRYFFSFPAPIGRVNRKRSTLHWRVHRAFAKAAIETNTRLVPVSSRNWGIVEHIVLDHFAGPQILLDLERRLAFYQSEPGMATAPVGVVIQGDFSRNVLFDELSIILDRIVRQRNEALVLFGSRKSHTRVMARMGSKQMGLVPRSLSHSKAQVKLSWLQRFGLPSDEILRLMNENVAGEIFEADTLPEWINYDTYPSLKPGVEVVIAYPGVHARVVVDAARRLGNFKGKRTLYVYGFGDGHIPTSNRSLYEIVTHYLDDQFTWKCDQQAENLDYILSSVVRQIRAEDIRRLVSYVQDRYIIDAVAIDRMVTRAAASLIFRRYVDQLEQTVVDAVSDLDITIAQHPAIGPITRKLRPIIDENIRPILRETGFQVRKADLQAEYRRLAGVNSVRESPLVLVIEMLIREFPREIAARFMKDAVMASSSLLQAIGDAVDLGIRVVVRTTAVKSKTNTSLYEVGQMLCLIGVDSDEVSRCDSLCLLPRKKLRTDAAGMYG